MRRALKILGLVVGALVVVVGAFLVYVQIDGIPRYPVEKVTFRADPTPERLERGKMLVNSALRRVPPRSDHAPAHRQAHGRRAEGVRAIYSPNITRHPTKGIGSWTDGELAYLIRTGVKRDGQYTPPTWRSCRTSPTRTSASIIAFMRSDDPMVAASDRDPPGVVQPSLLTKVLCHTVFKALPYPGSRSPSPPVSDKVAYGRYLVTALECYGCHSADFKTMNIAEPEKTAGLPGRRKSDARPPRAHGSHSPT